MDQQSLLEILDSVRVEPQDQEDIRAFRDKLANYLSPERKSYEREWQGLGYRIVVLAERTGRRYHWLLLDELIPALTQWEEGLGYRPDIYTMQEHKLKGSTILTETQPYIPLALRQTDPLEIGEVKRARELKAFTEVRTEYFLLESEIADAQRDIILITLEPLSEEGNTISDPRPVGPDLQVIKGFEYAPHFPYLRNGQGV